MGSALDRLAAQAAGDTTATGEPRPGFDASSALDSLAARAGRLASAQRALRRMLPPDFSDVATGASSTAPSNEFGRLLREGEIAAGRVVRAVPGAVDRAGQFIAALPRELAAHVQATRAQTPTPSSPFADVSSGSSSTASGPSLLARLGGAARSLAPTPADQMLYGGMPLLGAEAGPLARFATGIGRQAASDVGTLARASAPSAGIGAPGMVETPGQLIQRRAHAPAPGDVAMAGLRTALLAGGAGLADEAGTAALSRFLPGAVARPLARVATGAGTGAAFTPNDPAVGAIVGGVAGAVPSVAGLLARRGVPGVRPPTSPLAAAGVPSSEAVRAPAAAVAPVAPEPLAPRATPNLGPSAPVDVGAAGHVVTLPTKSIQVDPARFQFKQGLNPETGTGPELANVQRFNPDFAGTISVWRDPENGGTYVVNGHHRLALANRFGVPSLDVRYLNAPTAQAARATGALTNIAEGRGTPTDAAQFFHDTGLRPEDVAAQGVSMRGALAAKGAALSKLAPDLFRRVVTGDLPEDTGVGIGRILEQPEQQRAAAELVARGGRRLSPGEIENVARQVRDAGSEAITQESLFGPETTALSLAVPRARLAESVLGDLAKDRRLFGYVSTQGRPEELARAGNSINVQQSAQLATESGQLAELFHRLSTRTGPVGDLLTQGARRLARGEKLAAVKADLGPGIRAAVSETLRGGEGVGAPAGEGHAGEGPTATEEPARPGNRIAGPGAEREAGPAVARDIGRAASAPSTTAALDALERAHPATPALDALDRAAGPGEQPPTPPPSGTGVEERFGGLPVPARLMQAIGRSIREMFSDRYAMLDRPREQSLKTAIQETGAARHHGQAVADLGVASARRGIAPDMVRKIEAQLYADNAASAASHADARATALEQGTGEGADEQGALDLGEVTPSTRPDLVKALRQRAANFRRVQADAQGVAGPDVRRSPEYARYLAAYKRNVEPEFVGAAAGVGVTGEQLRPVMSGSAYVPFTPETDRTGIVPPSTGVGVKAGRLGTKTSGAAQTATGRAPSYTYDVAHNVARTLPDRLRVAGGNRIVNEVARLGRPVTDPTMPIPEGMRRVKIADAFGLAPRAGTVRQFDVREDVADALAVASQRLSPRAPTRLERGLGTLVHGVTGLDLALRPAVFVAHGLKNLGSLAGQVASGSALDDLAASAVPGYARAQGGVRLAQADVLDPENVRALLDLSRTGGLHPVETGKGLLHVTSRPLFGRRGLDMRTRLVLDQLLRRQAPDLTAAQRAQAVTEQAGNYVAENQPAFQHFGQATGLTSFAPAGVSFVRGSVRRLAGAPMYPGQSLGSRLATMGRIGGAGMGLLQALNYANTGHSTFANEPGHRLDVDRGKKDAQGREEYLAGSMVAPLMERALRATGAEGAINSDRAADVPLNVYRNWMNTALSQVGVGPRMGLGMANVAPYMTATGEAKVNVQPDFNPGRLPFRITQGVLGGVATGASALGGFDPYDANQSFSQRLANMAVGQVTRTGRSPRAIPPGFDDKLVGAMRQVEAAPAARKGQVMQQELGAAREARYPPWALNQLARALRTAAIRSR